MLRSLLIGAASGSRAFTPLAAASAAARRGALPDLDPRLRWLGQKWVPRGLGVMAAGEIGADKLSVAPDRTIPPGLMVRLATGGLAGAALAPRGRALLGAGLGAAAAVGAAYVTVAARKAAMGVVGQTASGLGEDALIVGASRALTDGFSPLPRRSPATA